MTILFYTQMALFIAWMHDCMTACKQATMQSCNHAVMRPCKMFVISFLLLFITYGLFSQNNTDFVKKITLRQVVELAKTQSPASLQAANKLENKYWQYQTYRSNYRPQLGLRGVIPDLTRSISSITLPDGSEAFSERSFANSSLNLSLSQNIGLTGGEVFINSQLQRIDIFGDNSSVSYSASPAIIGFRQPILSFNKLRWDMKIEPLKYEEAKKQYLEDMENIAVTATDLFFNLLLAQIRYEIAKKDHANNKKLYKIAQGRYNLGIIAENDLLQMELTLMNSKQDSAQFTMDIETSMLDLKTYLGVSDSLRLELIMPDNIPEFEVDEEKALSEAKKNSQKVITFERQLIEAERDVAQVKGENGFNASIFASFGLTQSATNIPEAYVNPKDQEGLRIGFNIPIIDWGRSKSRIKTVLANYELVESMVKMEKLNFDQQIYLQVKRFKMLRDQLEIAFKSDEIADRRYDITKKRYMVGKIGIMDLNIALKEKNEAKRGYISSLKNFWKAYYELRMVTLFDFESNIVIDYEMSY